MLTDGRCISQRIVTPAPSATEPIADVVVLALASRVRLGIVPEDAVLVDHASSSG